MQIQHKFASLGLARCAAMLLLCSMCFSQSQAQPAAVSAPQARAKHVLFLYSYNYGSKGVEVFNDSFRTTMTDAGYSISNMSSEFLDLERNKADPDYRSRLHDLLRRKYAGRKIDLVLTGQQPALDFLLREGRDLAPNAPAITTLAPAPAASEAGARRIVSHSASFDIKGTLEQAFKLFPETRRMVLVSGASDADRKLAAAAAELAAPWKDRCAFEFTHDLSLDDMLKSVAALSPHTLVLFTQYNRDAAGRNTVAYEVERMIVNAANAPVFGLYDFNLYNGGIGGSVLGVRKLGQSTAQLALNVLSGERRLTEPVETVKSEAIPMYDWAQLKRWGADPGVLPAETVFVNRVPPLWEQYKVYAIGLGVFLLAQSLLIAALLLSRRRRALAERHLQQSEEKYRVLVDHAPDAITIYDADTHRFIDCNAAAEELFGCSRGELLSRSMPHFQTAESSAIESPGVGVYEILGKALAGEQAMLLQTLRNSQGKEIVCEVRAVRLPPADRKLIRASFIDVTTRKLAEQKIEFLAYHDALTELPNRLLVKERFQALAAAADRARTKVALLYLDLDNFKTINDTLGHVIGDELIRRVGQRLKECARATDIVSRQGGDEFLVALPDLADAEATAPMLVRMMSRMVEPMIIEGFELATSASIGITIYPDDGSDFDSLMKKADLAMYRAKEAGRNTYRFFDAQMNVEAVEELRMRNGLRKALANGEFVLHYQPQIDLASGALIGAEALMRWNSPELGPVAPGRFIPVAEDSGMIVPMGEWALLEACRQAVAWQRMGLRDLVVAVNLSAVQFKRGDIEQSIVRALEESGLKPSLLELELTESILIRDTDTILATVKRLKQIGVKLSIDDFGTGYSSLSYLKRFQVDKIKIDQSFIKNLPGDEEDAAIVGAIIRIAHSLGLTAIAEGVETAEALACLRESGCDEAQGYHYARPMASDEFIAYRNRTLTGPERLVGAPGSA